MQKYISRLIFYISLVLAWALIAELKIWPDYIFPSPIGVLNSLFEGIKDHTFIIGTAVSLKRIAIGYGISIILGTILGMVIGRNRLLEETLGSLIIGLQALPSICWLPLSILWFGLSEKAIIFVVVMGALLAITISIISGVKNILPIYIKAGKNMGATEFELMRTIYLPAALPAIVTGLKQGWSFAWRSLLAGELIYVSIGLGQLLTMGRELNDMNRVIAVMMVLILIGLIFDKVLFTRMERKIRKRWGFEV